MNRVIWFGIWFVSLIAVTALLFLGATPLAERMRQRQAHEQLREIRRALADFRVANGGWPQVSEPAELLLALRGKVDARGKPASRQWFLTYVRMAFTRADPEAPGSMMLDPWGRPYRYVYQPAWGDLPESYILFSAGPDGKYSLPLAWLRGLNGAYPVDADNLWITPESPQ